MNLFSSLNKKILLVVLVAPAAFGITFVVHQKEAISPSSQMAQVPLVVVQETPKQAPLIATSTPLSMIFVGDIMLSRAIGNIMTKRKDWCYPFLNVAETLKDADITFGNLEGPISSKGVNIGSIYSFRASPQAVNGLRCAGIDVVSIANNHMWDYGRDAFNETLKILKENNIEYAGGGATYEEAHAARIIETQGTRVAFLGYTNLLPASLGKVTSRPAVAFPYEEDVVRDIQNAVKISDIVVVSVHWGDEYHTKHNAFQEKLGRLIIDSGADLVIGHHPHVVQEVEKYKTGYIAYSLGNFVFDQNFSVDTHWGLTLKVFVENKKIINIEERKVTFNSSYQPTFIPITPAE